MTANDNPFTVIDQPSPAVGPEEAEMPFSVESNPLTAIVMQSGLETTKADAILARFQDYFQIASKWEAKAKTIVVTSADQVGVMKVAREGRLALKNKRVEIEAVRKELKEQSLREGKTIDGIANVLKGLIEPIEDYLGEQENFVEVQEARRKATLVTTRTPLIRDAGGDPTLYNLGAMSDFQFNATLNALRVEVEQRAEEEAKAARKVEEERREAGRIRAENEKLRAEAEAVKVEGRRIAEETQRKLDAERKERERLEAEVKSRKDAEEKAAKQKVADARKSARAPDKEKILLFATNLDIIVRPTVASAEAQAMMDAADYTLRTLVQDLRTKVVDL